MKPIKHFEEFLREGIVKRQSPDVSRANFLLEESEKSYFFLNELVKVIGINEESANNIVKISYDIIMGMVRSKMIRKGYKASGQGLMRQKYLMLEKLDYMKKMYNLWIN